MLRTVWKYPVETSDRFTLSMPAGAQLLSVQFQETSGASLWALVDPNAEREERRFRVASTGRPIEGNVSFVGAFQLFGGNLTFHVFEELAS